MYIMGVGQNIKKGTVLHLTHPLFNFTVYEMKFLNFRAKAEVFP